jgi:Protein of unknown function (DUF973).
MSMSFQTDVIALQKLKDASLWFIIIGVLALIGEVARVAAVVMAIVDLVLLFMMAIPKLRDAFQTFASTGKDVSRGFTGINLILPGIIIELIGGILAIAGIFSASLGLAVAGGIIVLLAAIILFIAYLLIGLVIYNLGSFYNNDMLKIGGILIIIPFISFVGWILSYVSVDDIIRKLSGGTMMPQPYTAPSMYQPQVYQVGQGIIRLDGTVTLTLYSSITVNIVSASIDNTLYTTTDVNPNMLNPGNNSVTMRFLGVTGLVPGNNYYLTIYLSDGTSIKAVVTCTPT